MDEQALSSYYQRISAEQDRNNAWSAEQAQKAMDYQERMSNTAHQREVQDLIAAGLNPVLSAGGSGATTGSGVAASAGNENVTALYGLIKTAIDANMKQAEAMQNQALAVAEADSNGTGVSRNNGSGSLTEALTNPNVQITGDMFDPDNPPEGVDKDDWLRMINLANHAIDVFTDGHNANLDDEDKRLLKQAASIIAGGARKFFGLYIDKNALYDEFLDKAGIWRFNAQNFMVKAWQFLKKTHQEVMQSYGVGYDSWNNNSGKSQAGGRKTTTSGKADKIERRKDKYGNSSLDRNRTSGGKTRFTRTSVSQT